MEPIIDFYDQSNITDIAAASTVTLLSYQIPIGLVFVLTHFGTFVRDLAALTQLTWSVLYGNTPERHLNGIGWLIGSEGWPRRYPVLSDLIFGGGNSINVTCANSSATISFQGGAMLRGLIFQDTVAIDLEGILEAAGGYYKGE